MAISQRLHRFDDDEGAVTVEYAMLYLVAGVVGGLVYLAVSSDWFQDMVVDLIRKAIRDP